MTDQDRGAYTPQTDGPLAFDARRARSAGGGPAPFTLVVSAIIFILLAVALVLFYRSGVRPAGQAPQVLGQPVTQAKAPPSEAPAASDAAGLQVYKTEATPPSEMKPTFAPPPETPAPRAAPAAPAQAAPTPSALRPAQAAPPPAAPTVVADNDEPSMTPVRPPPVADSHLRTELSAPSAPKPAHVAAPALTPAPAPALGGGALVQIGAFSSQALAEKGWSDLAAATPGHLAGRTRKVEAASHDGKSFYRAFVGGFASPADAKAFCAKLQAAGKSCMVR